MIQKYNKGAKATDKRPCFEKSQADRHQQLNRQGRNSAKRNMDKTKQNKLSRQAQERKNISYATPRNQEDSFQGYCIVKNSADVQQSGTVVNNNLATELH